MAAAAYQTSSLNDAHPPVLFFTSQLRTTLKEVSQLADINEGDVATLRNDLGGRSKK